MSDEQKTEAQPEEKPAAMIHRVCIQCNNMFQVTSDRIEAKQCPNCHKG